jgi:hypothetical protein
MTKFDIRPKFCQLPKKLKIKTHLKQMIQNGISFSVPSPPNLLKLPTVAYFIQRYKQNGIFR